MLLSWNVIAQIVPPYTNNFDTLTTTPAWTHYAISGSDDWELGVPNGFYFLNAHSLPNAWVTGLTQNYSLRSDMALETPSFDLSTAASSTEPYVLSFYHRHRLNNGRIYLEYSIDNGVTWLLLDKVNTLKTYNWQTVGGFSGSNSTHFLYSAISLNFLQGNSNVKFRFRLESTTSRSAGWLIDDFSIVRGSSNLYGVIGDTINVSQKCPDISVSTTLGFYEQNGMGYVNTIDYYLSTDTVLDGQDILLGTFQNYIDTTDVLTSMISLPQGLNTGIYYLLNQQDVFGIIPETNELDNVGYSVLKLDTVRIAPYFNDLEQGDDGWESYTVRDNGNVSVWAMNSGTTHHLEGAHSGINAWHTTDTSYVDANCIANCSEHYLEFPYLDISGTPNAVLSMWYKKTVNGQAPILQYSADCGVTWTDMLTFPYARLDDWDHLNISLSSLPDKSNVMLRIEHHLDDLFTGSSIDDIYVGQPLADLTIEGNKDARYTTDQSLTDTIFYELVNSGLVASLPSNTDFYWSTDSILDVNNDTYLGSKLESAVSDTTTTWSSFVFNKPTLSTGTYYIFYQLDVNNTVQEMREGNNIGMFTIDQYQPIVTPYFNDLEQQVNDWKHRSSLGKDSWYWANHRSNIVEVDRLGQNSWIVDLYDSTARMSRMHLYTPVFDLTAMTEPVLTLDIVLLADTIPSSCDCYDEEMNISYSVDGGANWIILDGDIEDYNMWYERVNFDTALGDDEIETALSVENLAELLFDADEPSFVSYNRYKGRDTYNGIEHVINIEELKGYDHVQFRINVASNEGDIKAPVSVSPQVVIDNFRISEAFVDLTVGYTKSLQSSSLNNNVIFDMNVSNYASHFAGPFDVNYYLSADTVLDVNDPIIGIEQVDQIRPMSRHYINALYPALPNMDQYSYLLYEIDPANTVTESNENNNTGYWTLDNNIIDSYPYVEDFNDTILNGWRVYLRNSESEHMVGRFRVRHMLVRGQRNVTERLSSGQIYTEPLYSGFTLFSVPYNYIESPSFDLSNVDSISVAFDLFLDGRPSSPTSGGNLSYSVDGGNTWTVLTNHSNIALNWYNGTTVSSLFGEPGWTENIQTGDLRRMYPRWNVISFLAGEPDVMFRFKYRSGHYTFGAGYTFGMRIDNFVLYGVDNGSTFDHQALTFGDTVIADLDTGSVVIDYDIMNAGLGSGRRTVTGFYWSDDMVLDVNDTPVKTAREAGIPGGDTITNSIEIPLLSNFVKDSTYYLFYMTDNDSTLSELSELNNVGYLNVKVEQDTVVIDTTIVPVGVSNMDDVLQKTRLFVNGRNVSLNRVDTDDMGKAMVDVYNIYGQKVYSYNVVENSRSALFVIPSSIIAGNYFVLYSSDKETIVVKTMILDK